jgi:putative salt-induced outer membrane protein
MATGLGVASMSCAGLAQAQLEDFEVMDNPATAEKPFEGTAELGYSKISGNSNSESLRAGADMTWFNAPWSYSLKLATMSASDNDETSAEEYLVAGRTRYNLSTDNYLFGLARWDKDRFSGYESQSTLAGGYGRQLLTGPPQSLTVEVGPGVRHDEYEEGGNDNVGLLYAGLDYDWQFSDTSKFSQSLATEASEENIIGRSETALTVAMNDTLALKISYEAEFNDSPPPGASSQTDTTTGVSLIYNM